MRFFFATLLFVILAVGAAPSAQAQALSSSCRSDADCPIGSRCSMSNFNISGNCTSVLTPSGNTQSSVNNVSPVQSSANNIPGANITLINPLNTGDCTPNGTCLMQFLNRILEFVIQIGAIAVILMLVYVGYLFVVAQGSETKITEAKKALLWTVIGALILLGSQAISLGIQATVQAISVGN